MSDIELKKIADVLSPSAFRSYMLWSNGLPWDEGLCRTSRYRHRKVVLEGLGVDLFDVDRAPRGNQERGSESDVEAK